MAEHIYGTLKRMPQPVRASGWSSEQRGGAMGTSPWAGRQPRLVLLLLMWVAAFLLDGKPVLGRQQQQQCTEGWDAGDGLVGAGVVAAALRNQQAANVQQAAIKATLSFSKTGCRGGGGAVCGTGGAPALSLDAELLATSPLRYDARNPAHTGGVVAAGPARDMGACANSVTFAVVAAAEAAIAMATRTNATTLDLSEQDLQLCSGDTSDAAALNKPCAACWGVPDALNALVVRQRTGRALVQEACMRYATGPAVPPGNGNCSRKACAAVDARLALPGDRFEALRVGSIAEQQQCIRRYGALMTVLRAPPGELRAWFARNRTGIYNGSVAANATAAAARPLAVALVGYDNYASFWIAKAPWGPGFADGGYFRIHFGAAGVGDPRSTRCVRFRPAMPPPLGPDLLRALPAATAPAAAAGCYSYTGRAGDYVSGLADRYGVPSARILSDNQGAITDLQAPLAGVRLRLCGLPPGSPYVVPASQLEALLRFKAAVDPKDALWDWTVETGARGGYCDWVGIVCDAAQNVVEVNSWSLRGDGWQDLAGQLPSEALLLGLPNLEQISVNGVNLTGVLPRGWGAVHGLQVISLFGNKLQGTLPHEWGALAQLEALDLSENDLSGTVPEEWAGMKSLKRVSLVGNPRLRGCLPHTWVGVEREAALPLCAAA